MPSDASSRYELYFDDPRLRMTVAGRFFVRTMVAIVYVVLFFAMVTFLMSEVRGLFYVGVFLAIFFLDRILHWGEADLPIAELPPRGKINLARIMKPSTSSIISRAFDRGLVARQDFFLCAADRLLGLAEVEEGLRRLDVKPEEFRAKLAEFLSHPHADSAPALNQSGAGRDTLRDEYLKNAETLAVAAFGQALAAGHNFIEPSDLFSALATMPSERLQRLFNMFGVEAGDLERALIFSLVKRPFGRLPRVLGGFIFDANRRMRHRIMNRAWTARPTPDLGQIQHRFHRPRAGRAGGIFDRP